jgi:hypothetical protein
MRSGNTFKVSSKEALDLHDQLPAGNYVIKQDMFENLFLEQIDSFAITGKVYGDTLKQTDRILNTFMSRPSSTGVMLNGEKGSGKTLLAKSIAVTAALTGIPTIIINTAWVGDKFNSFLQMIEQPVIILFDEFEKVYKKEDQEGILTLLDGVFPSKKLFVLTCNDKWRIDTHMRNRPGRIFYMLDFTGLDAEFIREYCVDNLQDQSHVGNVYKISRMFGQFNFDMLKALCEEMNRYSESPQEAIRMLNAKPEFDGGKRYSMRVIHKGVAVPQDKIEGSAEWSGNPLNPDDLSVRYSIEKSKSGNYDCHFIYMGLEDLVHMDSGKGEFTFKKNTEMLIVTEISNRQKFDFYAF